MSKGTTFEYGANILQTIWNAATRKSAKEAPTLAAHAATDELLGGLTKSGLKKEGLKAALLARNESRHGLLNRPIMGADALARKAAARIDGLISAQAEKNLKGSIEGLSDSARKAAIEGEAGRLKQLLKIGDVDGMSAPIGKFAEKGGSYIKSAGKSTLELAAKNPGKTLLGTGALTAYAYSNVSEGGIIDNVLGGTGSILGTGLGAGVNGLSGIFNFVSGNLEYLGMDPQWAHGITAVATFMSLRAVMDFGFDKTAEALGMKQFPLAGFATFVGAGLLALQIANAASDDRAPAPELAVAKQPVTTPALTL